MPLLALSLASILVAAYLLAAALLGARTLMRAPANWPAGRPEDFGLPEGETLSLTAADGTRLEAAFFGRPGPAAVVLLHGHTAHRAQSYPVAAALAAAGLSALCLDFRGHGASQPAPASLGVKEKLDLGAALDALEARGYARIGVWGMSMGGAVALTAAAEEPRIRAVATDGTFARRAEAVIKRVRDRRYPLAGLVGRLIWGCVRGQLALGRPVDPLAAIARLAPRPVLILHGDADATAPVDAAHRLFAAAGMPKALFVAPGAAHTATRAWWPGRYDAIVSDFFAKALMDA